MELRPIVEVEDEIYSFAEADNGAGPLWCHGSTVVVRQGEEVFAAALETLPEQPPLNNCRWLLYRRTAQGWELVHRDSTGRTREPSPIVLLAQGGLLVSANPTLTEPGAHSGPARPTAFHFSTARPQNGPAVELPSWQGEPAFSEHSYRTVTADGGNGEVLYMQNVGYDLAHMSFRDRGGDWRGVGKLSWPHGHEYDPPQPLRLCYPNVVLRNRAAHFFGVGDIVEPVEAWRQAKFEITQRKWDYVFRRLFYAYTPDITTTPFGEWLEVANRDATAGAMRNGDVHVDAAGITHLIWCETSVDVRLRDRFFPDQTVVHALEYMSLRDGVELTRRTLACVEESEPGLRPELGRFHVLADGTLIALASFRRNSDDPEYPPLVYRLAVVRQEAETSFAERAASCGQPDAARPGTWEPADPETPRAQGPADSGQSDAARPSTGDTADPANARARGPADSGQPAGTRPIHDAPPHWVDIPFSRPLAGTFLTNTVRGGSAPSNTIDLVGNSPNRPRTLGYARVRVAG